MEIIPSRYCHFSCKMPPSYMNQTRIKQSTGQSPNLANIQNPPQTGNHTSTPGVTLPLTPPPHLPLPLGPANSWHKWSPLVVNVQQTPPAPRLLNSLQNTANQYDNVFLKPPRFRPLHSITYIKEPHKALALHITVSPRSLIQSHWCQGYWSGYWNQ